MGSRKLSEQFDGTTNEAQPFDPTAEISGPTFNDTGVIYTSVSDGACTKLSAICNLELEVPKAQVKLLPKATEVKGRFKIKHFDIMVC